MKTIGKKNLQLILAFSACAVLALVGVQQSMAATTTTNTTLGITPGTFSFVKDTTTTMNSYFGAKSPNAAAAINIGTYGASFSATSANSSGDHRFTVTDLLGSSFSITIQSSALTTAGGTIAATAVGYTGTAWLGTGTALVGAPTSAVSISTPVTFVSRTNANGLSQFSQEITLKVAIPAAQSPGSYTGLITFTY